MLTHCSTVPLGQAHKTKLLIEKMMAKQIHIHVNTKDKNVRSSIALLLSRIDYAFANTKKSDDQLAFVERQLNSALAAL